MPKMDGIQAAKLIQDTCPTPVVILTAHESTDLIDMASETGAGAYLTKPPNAGEIARAVTIAIARHGDLMASRRLVRELREEKEKLERALSEIKTLKGLVPICANCKKIRDDDGFWEQVEVYISDHTEAEFSHSICPVCVKKLYPELYKDK